MAWAMLRLCAPVLATLTCLFGVALEAARPAHAQGFGMPGFGAGPMRRERAEGRGPRGMIPDELREERERRRSDEGRRSPGPNEASRGGSRDPGRERGVRMDRGERFGRRGDPRERGPEGSRRPPNEDRAGRGNPRRPWPGNRPDRPRDTRPSGDGPYGSAACRRRGDCGRPDGRPGRPADTAGTPSYDPNCRRPGGCRPDGRPGRPADTAGTPSYDPNCRRRPGGCRPDGRPGRPTDTAGTPPYDPNCRRRPGGCRPDGNPGRPTDTADTPPYDPNCRRRPGGCRPDGHPVRPPVIVVIPPIGPDLPEPEPEDLPPSYDSPERPTPVYEPAGPRAPTPPRRQVDRAAPPSPPAPPAGLISAEAPIPPRRDLTLGERPQFRPNELLVTIDGAQPEAVAGQLAQTFNLTILESQGFALLENRRVYRFSIPDNRPVETVVAVVGGTPGVTQSSPNFLYYLQGAGATAKEALSLQYALPKLRVPDTQDLVSGRGVTVAVIDSGVDTRHPALKEADITFFDAVDGGVKDPDQHGTAITGIIAGRGEISGIAPEAKILAIRAFAPERLGAPPSTSSLALARATDTAFAKGARVFNMSFAGPRDPLLLSLIDAGYEKGAVFVAAAGNAGPSAPPAYPAAYEKVIGITATDEDDGLYAMANRGAYVSIAAPGVDILAPVVGKSLDYMSGTSFAAAHISGIVALLKERNAKLAPDEVRRILLQAAHDLGAAGVDNDFGAGLADAYRALVMASPSTGAQSSINP